ncbi:MAG: protein kinase domain-containing protein [Solirubrobacteraceae bacterium]
MPATQASVSLPSRYRVVRHIANGGMAGVWAAEDELLGRLVAVKVLSPAFASDERAAKRFMREARAGARLSDCRHIVTVYDIGEHEGKAFMVMEHFPGGTLSDRLKSGRPIPRPLAVRWLREAAEALDCAHRNNVVHRDVKPANLLLDERGRLAVGDFGIATVASEASVTMTGQVLGTAAYISPEQARGETATAASDRYALAVVAYELLTGRRPFAAEHPAAQARAHVEGEVPLASENGDGLPPAVDAVLAAGMAKDPRERPASACDLVDRLEDALGGDAEPATTMPTATTAPVAVPRAPERRAPTTGSHRAVRPAAGHAARRPAPRRASRWPALLVLAVIALLAGAVIAIATSGGGTKSAKSTTPTTSKATAKKPHRSTTSTPAQTQSAQTQPQSTSTPAGTPAGTDPVALNNQGFALIQQGNAAAAVPLEQKAVDQFRAQNRRGEVDYAYALYNLGTALVGAGQPAAAIPYLQERLQVSDYKRDVVQKELALAQQQAGQTPSKPGKGKGKKKGG